MTQAASRGPAGLFWRIYLTFVLTVVVFTGLAGLAIWQFSGEYDAEWVESVASAVNAREEALRGRLGDPPALEREVAALAKELDLRVSIRDLEGTLLAGDAATRAPRNWRPRQRSRLLRGEPVLGRGERGERGPALSIGLREGEGEVVAVVHLDTGDGAAERQLLLSVALLGLLAVLASGAWPLARSLTRRLAALEQGAGRIARGELAYRVAERDGSNDEIDRLGRAFNAMAGRLEAMIRSQRMLLTNVSHELRTPVARMRVLTELLGERITELPDADHPATARLGKGLGELGEDLVELETLIGDLLTSGKLELAARPAGATGPTIPRTELQVLPLLSRAATKVGARIDCTPPDLTLAGDGLLLERLLANLLHNARRACPEGQIMASGRVDGDHVVLAVEDEGPGIAPEDRRVIFDPFTRLDAARARDHGGVGLGLYLCRQIAEAHGGTIAAEDRLDRQRGARLAVRLPRA